jgi:hypothetical protein
VKLMAEQFCSTHPELGSAGGPNGDEDVSLRLIAVQYVVRLGRCACPVALRLVCLPRRCALCACPSLCALWQR